LPTFHTASASMTIPIAFQNSVQLACPSACAPPSSSELRALKSAAHAAARALRPARPVHGQRRVDRARVGAGVVVIVRGRQRQVLLRRQRRVCAPLSIASHAGTHGGDAHCSSTCCLSLSSAITTPTAPKKWKPPRRAGRVSSASWMGMVVDVRAWTCGPRAFLSRCARRSHLSSSPAAAPESAWRRAPLIGEVRKATGTAGGAQAVFVRVRVGACRRGRLRKILRRASGRACCTPVFLACDLVMHVGIGGQ
jgi:hypothetical protein